MIVDSRPGKLRSAGAKAPSARPGSGLSAPPAGVNCRPPRCVVHVEPRFDSGTGARAGGGADRTSIRESRHDGLHRRLGAFEVRAARGRGPRVPHQHRRRRRGGGCGGRAGGRRRHLRRPLQPRVLRPGLSVLPRHPGRRPVPLHAGHPGRERLRDRLGRDPPGAQPHRSETREDRARRRGGEDDGHAGPGGRRHPPRSELPQGGRGDRRRLRGRLRDHRAALLPEVRRSGRGPRPHRGQEPSQRLRQPVGADPQGPRLRLLPRGLGEEPDRGEPAEAHRLLARVGRGGRGGARRPGDGARPRQGRGVPRAKPDQRVPADEPPGHDLPRRVARTPGRRRSRKRSSRSAI